MRTVFGTPRRTSPCRSSALSARRPSVRSLGPGPSAAPPPGDLAKRGVTRDMMLAAGEVMTRTDYKEDGETAESHARSAPPEQVRNRVALLIGFDALTTHKAICVRQGDVDPTPSGRVVTPPPGALVPSVSMSSIGPSGPGGWLGAIWLGAIWLGAMGRGTGTLGLRSAGGPALFDAHQLGVPPHSLAERGLNQRVQRRPAGARMSGTSSCRRCDAEAIRAAIRDNDRMHHVAALAAAGLDTTARHRRREQLTAHSVAGQVFGAALATARSDLTRMR